MSKFILAAFLLDQAVSVTYPVCAKAGKVCNVAGGECCSKFDYCGKATEWCNPDSKYGYYEKFNNSDSNPNNGNGRPICPSAEAPCSDSECCSATGYCGIGEDFCNSDSIYLQGNTSYPTPAPTNRKPKPQFVGCPCIIEGDPHIHQFNCFRINYQGPHAINPPGSFRYMTKCNDYYEYQMPFDVIGVHVRWGDYFTALDYIIVKLFDDDETEYDIRVSGENGVSLAGDGWENIQENKNIQIGSKFVINWKKENGLTKFELDITSDEECPIDLTINSQRLFNTVYQDAATIQVSDCYKKYTCGLCGSFERKFPLFETARGEIVTVDQGYFGETAENFDAWGYLVAGSRNSGIAQRRRALTSYEPSNMTSACFGLESDTLLAKCAEEIKKYETCCATKSGYCEKHTSPECSVDACACISHKMQQNGLTTQADALSLADTCVADTIKALTNFTCNIDDSQFVVPSDVLPVNMTNAYCDDLVRQAAAVAKSECGNTGTAANGLSVAAAIIIGIIIGIGLTLITGFGIYSCMVQRKAKQDFDYQNIVQTN